MKEYQYHLVDVFTEQRFGGNQLAVFAEADGLTAEDMYAIANELNLSESAFVFPADDPTCDFKVRFFTPQIELPMAGHPTVGTAYVLRKLGKATRDSVRLEEGVGPLTINYNPDGSVTMNQPVPQFSSVFEDRSILANLLSLNENDLHPGYPAQVVSAGVPFIYIPIRDLEAIGRIKLNLDVWDKHIANYETPHIFTFTPSGAHVRSRMFAPAMGIPEDPATGAASGPLGAYLFKYGVVTAEEALSIVSDQGVEMGRPSKVLIRVETSGDEITAVSIGGTSVDVGYGVMYV